jgi:hypothetical protein
MDWASRAVLAWRLTNSMDSSFCSSALHEALARFGRPEIFNTDQGSQFMAFYGAIRALRHGGRKALLFGKRSLDDTAAEAILDASRR